MKDQYFGDINDFRKYGLLRSLVHPDGLRLGVCWMLTECDNGSDGSFLKYLRTAAKYRPCDPELFDWLSDVVGINNDRRTARIEQSSLLADAKFQSTILTDRANERSAYFAECSDRFAGCDLVFFDPDNGLEVRSVTRGRKDSCKYLFWEEVCCTFAEGSSVLIYQHFPRLDRQEFIATKAEALRLRTGAPAIFSFSTPFVLFLLASHDRHQNTFRRRIPEIASTWARADVRPAEHIAPGAIAPDSNQSIAASGS